MVKYRLTYFDIRGLAETSRILFFLAGEEYYDHRYPIKIGETFEKPEYDHDRDEGLFTVGMDRIPILSVDDNFQLGQSKVIERYLAKNFGFMGENAEQEAYIDMICEHVRDIKQKHSDAKAKNRTLEFLEEDLPVWLEKLDKLVEGDTYSVGNNISLADVVIFGFFHDYFDDKKYIEKASVGCPNLAGISEFVGMIIKDWIEKRPVTPF